jgi:hypothetical protein
MFAQLLILFGCVSERLWVPMIYMVMPRRDEQTYARTYQLLQETLHNKSFILLPCPISHSFVRPKIFCKSNCRNLDFPPDLRMMTDFELAERNPWRLQWPGHELKGCNFHYCQAQWRYVQRRGRSEEYSSSPMFR